MDRQRQLCFFQDDVVRVEGRTVLHPRVGFVRSRLSSGTNKRYHSIVSKPLSALAFTHRESLSFFALRIAYAAMYVYVCYGGLLSSAHSEASPSPRDQNQLILGALCRSFSHSTCLTWPRPIEIEHGQRSDCRSSSSGVCASSTRGLPLAASRLRGRIQAAFPGI